MSPRIVDRGSASFQHGKADGVAEERARAYEAVIGMLRGVNEILAASPGQAIPNVIAAMHTLVTDTADAIDRGLHDDGYDALGQRIANAQTVALLEAAGELDELAAHAIHPQGIRDAARVIRRRAASYVCRSTGNGSRETR